MTGGSTDFWTDETSVVFTSFYGWTPETWGTVGWTSQTHRDKLLKELSDPFITVVYVTGNRTFGDPDLKGKIAGFYLVSHETGDRDEFTHPSHHTFEPGKWRYSVRALRAFSYVSEHRVLAKEFDSELFSRARSISTWGEVLTDRRLIKRLREMPWFETDVYMPPAFAQIPLSEFQVSGMVRPGPQNKGGYTVAEATNQLDWQLYVLRLKGDASAFLGYDAKGRMIYKIGLSRSPEKRRLDFQSAIPQGAYIWQVDRANKSSKLSCYDSFSMAECGEYAMKKHLASCAKHLGGEFYLATKAQIDKAWQLGHAAAKSFKKKA